MAKIGAHLENFGRVFQELIAADGKISNDDSINPNTGEGIGDVAKLTRALLKDAHNLGLEGYVTVSKEAVSFLQGEHMTGGGDAFEDDAMSKVLTYAVNMSRME
jgi:hypothetical protein